MTQSLHTVAGLSNVPARPVDAQDLFGARQQEGEALLQAHARLKDAGGGVVLLCGPRGMGKGQLLTGLQQSIARARTGPVFQASASGQHRPYSAVGDVIRASLAYLHTHGQTGSIVERHARALAVLEPSMGMGGHVNVASRLGFQEDTLALLRDVGAACSGTFILSELDDGDEDTRALCFYVARHLRSSQALGGMVLVLCVSDSAESLVPDLLGLPHVERVQLGGLDKEGLLRFLRNSAVVEKLLSASGGRPGDVDELLSVLPLDVGSLLQGRLDRLGAHARSVVHALSICESPMGVDTLCAMTSLAANVLAPTLQRLCEDGLVEKQVSNGALLFQVKKPAHARRVKEALPAAERSGLNLRLAQHLEGRGAGMLEGGDVHLAQHFLAAQDGAKGIAYALSAVEHLTVTHAYGTALDLLDKALPLSVETQDRQNLLSRRALVHQLQGNLMAALCDAGRAKGAFPAHARAVAYLCLGDLLAESGRARPAVHQLERALALVDQGAQQAERGPILASLAEALYVAGELSLAKERAQQALAWPGMTEQQSIKARNTLGKLALAQEEWTAAQGFFQHNRDRAVALGLQFEATRAELNLGVTGFRSGQYDAAEPHFGRALQIATVEGDLPSQALCVLNLGALKHQQRDLAGAQRHYHESLALFEKIGNRAEVVRAHLNVANLNLVLGELGRAAHHLEQARRVMEETGLTTRAAYLAALEGDLAVSKGELSQAASSYVRARDLYSATNQRGRSAEQWLRLAQVALRARALADAGQALSHLTAVQQDLDHARLKVEATVAQARFTMASGISGADAAARVPVLLEDARTQAQSAKDPEALAMATFAESELWTLRGDARRATRLDAAARDILHGVASHLPPALRDGYVRSRTSLLSMGAPVKAAPNAVVDGSEENTPATGSTSPEDTGPRTEAWNQRYKAIIGKSPAVCRMFGRLDKLQGTLSTVLIRGESGTGKELVANALHALSPRASGPLVKVNCAALVETLLLSELFGHEKGSFTGAHTRKVGRFELAKGGTIFLDEIGDISANTQVSLLRVLQERVFERVGGGVPIKAECRVICATNRNLEAMVKAGTFREDLYYRLKGVQVEVPALRERREDIPALVDHVAALASVELGRSQPKVSPAAMEVLCRYDWPGNIREMENTVRSLVLFADGVVGVEQLKEFKELNTRAMSRPAGGVPGATLPTAGVPLGAFKKQIETDAISRALEQAGGNISQAAALLQMKRPRLSQIVNGNPELRALKDRVRPQGDGGAA